ncbi:hypothetical protein SESBI_12825 [Sesbania bispinosa]|nr:hypothetical protein SESBI_12825 [Sesbania bispinosa]
MQRDQNEDESYDPFAKLMTISKVMGIPREKGSNSEVKDRERWRPWHMAVGLASEVSKEMLAKKITEACHGEGMVVTYNGFDKY